MQPYSAKLESCGNVNPLHAWISCSLQVRTIYAPLHRGCSGHYVLHYDVPQEVFLDPSLLKIAILGVISALREIINLPLSAHDISVLSTANSTGRVQSSLQKAVSFF